MQTIEIRQPWKPMFGKQICGILDDLGITWRLATDNGRGAIIIEMDESDDQRFLALWDELSDIRARYIDQRQRSVAVQASFLERGEG